MKKELKSKVAYIDEKKDLYILGERIANLNGTYNLFCGRKRNVNICGDDNTISFGGYAIQIDNSGDLIGDDENTGYLTDNGAIVLEDKKLVYFDDTGNLFLEDKKIAHIDNEGNLIFKGNKVAYLNDDGNLILAKDEIASIDNEKDTIKLGGTLAYINIDGDLIILGNNITKNCTITYSPVVEKIGDDLFRTTIQDNGDIFVANLDDTLAMLNRDYDPCYFDSDKFILENCEKLSLEDFIKFQKTARPSLAMSSYPNGNVIYRYKNKIYTYNKREINEEDEILYKIFHARNDGRNPYRKLYETVKWEKRNQEEIT